MARWRHGRWNAGFHGWHSLRRAAIRSGVQLAGEKLPQAALHQLAGTAEAGDRRTRKRLAPELGGLAGQRQWAIRLSDSLFNWRS